MIMVIVYKMEIMERFKLHVQDVTKDLMIKITQNVNNANHQCVCKIISFIFLYKSN